MNTDLYLCAGAEAPSDLKLCVRGVVGGEQFERTAIATVDIDAEASRSVARARAVAAIVAAVVDQATRQQALARTATVDADATATAARTVQHTRDASDVAADPDAQADRLLQQSRTAWDVIDLPDVVDVSRSATFRRTVTDAAATSVSASRVVGYVRGVIEGLPTPVAVAVAILQGRPLVLRVTVSTLDVGVEAVEGL